MIVRGYLVLEPGMDRACFWHSMPTHYKYKPGAKVFSFDLDVPEFDKVDGRITAVATPVEPKDGTPAAG
jgi:hypothetical protein